MHFNNNKNSRITIAVDGHSSCGKSTLARDLAAKLSYIYVDTGAMYRAITLKMLQHKIKLDDKAGISSLLSDTEIHFEKKGSADHLILDGVDVESMIRTPLVASHVSPVAEISAIRKFLVKLQQHAGASKGVVMEGRDIGTVVFPDAELKFFVTADLETRTERRYLELRQKGVEVSRENVRKNLLERDYIDSNREDSPLTRHSDAILVDTSLHSRESQLEFVYSIACQKINSLS